MPRKAKQALQDKVAAVKREAILDAARHVFAEKGFHRATIKDIASQAGVADGTVYNHFENKEALLWALFDRLYETETRSLPPPGRPFDAATTTAFRQRVSDLDEARLELLRVLMSEMLVDEALRTRYRERVLKPSYAISEYARAAGQPTTPEAELGLQLTSATVLGLIMLRLLGDQQVEENWTALTESLLQRVEPEPGLNSPR